MTAFLHDDPLFPDVLEQVAASSPLKSIAMVEKDYWITHTLWALHRTPLTFIFKGGTALSKGFRITNRFSEDIDLVVDHSVWPDLPNVDNWYGSGKPPSRQRKMFWEEVVSRLAVPGVPLEIDHEADPTYRNVKISARYPGAHHHTFVGSASGLRPYVLVELTHNNPDRCAVCGGRSWTP